MKKYNNKYRVVSEFDDSNKIPFDETNRRSYEMNFIWCDKGRIRITRHSRTILRATMFGKIYKNRVSKIKKEGIEILAEYDLDGEGWILFKEKDIDIMCKILKARKQRKTPISHLNKKENLKLWKSSQKWVGV